MSTTARDAAEIAANAALGSIRNGRTLPEEIAAAIRAAFPADPVSGEGVDETEPPKVITPGDALWAFGLAEEEVKRLRAEIAALRAQLPKEMQDCKIVFEECKVGHGSLRGTNWVKQECPWCEIATLRAALEKVIARGRPGINDLAYRLALSDWEDCRKTLAALTTPAQSEASELKGSSTPGACSCFMCVDRDDVEVSIVTAKPSLPWEPHVGPPRMTPDEAIRLYREKHSAVLSCNIMTDEQRANYVGDAKLA